MFSVFTKIPISAVKLLDSRKNTSLRTNQKDLASFVDPFVLWLSKIWFQRKKLAKYIYWSIKICAQFSGFIRNHQTQDFVALTKG